MNELIGNYSAVRPWKDKGGRKSFLFRSSWKMFIMWTTRKQCGVCVWGGGDSQRVSKLSLWALWTFKWLLTFSASNLHVQLTPNLVYFKHTLVKSRQCTWKRIRFAPNPLAALSGTTFRSCFKIPAASWVLSPSLPLHTSYPPPHLRVETNPIPKVNVGKATLTHPGLLLWTSLVHLP